MVDSTDIRRIIPVMRPSLPKTDELLGYLRQIDESRWYTNFGPLEERFREAFAAWVGAYGDGVTADSVATFSSGTSALIAAFNNLGVAAGSRCLVPAWTFMGSVGAIVAAGLEPVFIDVEPDSWMPSMEKLPMVAREHGAESALIVVPFGARFDYGAWNGVARDSDLRIIIDAAAAVFSVREALRSGLSDTCIMISTHATKPISTGEGGLLLSGDKQFIRACQSWSNFGIYDSDPVTKIGVNAKLSEYHAAIGLVCLNDWRTTRTALLERSERYVTAFASEDIGFAPNIRQQAPATTFSIVSPYEADALASELSLRGVETKSWWKRGVHRIPAYHKYARSELRRTDELAGYVLGIPMFSDLTPPDQNRVIDAIRESIESVSRKDGKRSLEARGGVV